MKIVSDGIIPARDNCLVPYIVIARRYVRLYVGHTGVLVNKKAVLSQRRPRDARYITCWWIE